jgi:hypothetical protein
MRLNKLIVLLVSLTFAALNCRFASAQMDITTWQVNTSHTGVNPTEQRLTPAFVSGSSNVTCLFAEQVDGQVNAQPLYLTSTTSSKLPGSFSDGAQHNAVYVATQNGTVYAIDGDRTSDGCNKVNQNYLWVMPLVNYKNGPTPNGQAEAYQDIKGAADITPLLGLTETPVIDTVTGTLYVVVSVKDTQDLPAATPFIQVLYALDVKTGNVKGFTIIDPEFNGDYTPQACVANTTCDTVTPSQNGRIPFVPEHQHLRSSLTLDSAHHTLYLAYASHNDQTPYWGLVLGYNVSDPAAMTLQGEFNTHPTGSDEEAGVWMGGASPALDPNTNQLFFATGNGSWNQNLSGSDSNGPFTSGTDFAMSVLSLSTDPTTIVNYRREPEMRVPFAQDSSGNFHWFTPSQWNTFNNGDRDLGSGGLLLLPPLPGADGETRNLMLVGGKAGVMYLLDRTNLGGIALNDTSASNPNAVQQIIEPNAGIFNTPTYFNGAIYYGASSAIHRRAVGFDAATGGFISSSETMSTQGSPQSTSGNFVSASSPTSGGVVWQVNNGIFAWDANNVQSAIFSANAQNANGLGQLWFGEQNAVLNGSPDPNGVDGFAGNLDEVRIYNRVLSQTDISDLMGDPVLQVTSLQTSGSQTLGVPLFPSPVPFTEPRVPANQTYTIKVQFAAPLTATPTAVLQGQPGTANVTGVAGTPTLDATQTIMTVPLTGVMNAQVDLHLSNINTTLISNAVQDIPFNVLYGDVSQDHRVDHFDSAEVTLQKTGSVNTANAIFDLNGDGVIDANDVAVVTQNQSAVWTAPGDTNLAFFKTPGFATSFNGGNVAANAFDNNVSDNWETIHAPNGNSNTGVPGLDPSFIYVDLGSPATVDGFAIQWGGSAAQNYTIDACTGTVNSTSGACSNGWQNMVTATNGMNNELQSYNDLPPVTAEFFRMNGTVRVNAPFGYQIDEFYVFGSFAPGSTQPPATPVINSLLTETATVRPPFGYTITSNPIAASFSATGLPASAAQSSRVHQQQPGRSASLCRLPTPPARRAQQH